MIYPALLRHEASRLRRKGRSLNEVSSYLGIAKSTASLWARNIRLSPEARKIIRQKIEAGQFQPGNIQWQKADRSKYLTKWTPERLQKVKSLYQSGLSMRQVGQKMNVSLASIKHTMERNDIKRRTPSQTNKIRFYNSPLSFSPKKNLTNKEKQLKTAGLMLYWAEGSKKSPDKVDFANSDPLMIRLFIKFIRTIYCVDQTRLRCLIYCYPSHDIRKLTGYWSKLTNVPTSQFTRPYVRKDGGNIRDKMKFGLLHIVYSDKRLFELVLKEIRKFSYNI